MNDKNTMSSQPRTLLESTETGSKTNAQPNHSPVRLKSEKILITKELLDNFLYGKENVERIDVGKLMTERKRKAENTENEYSRKIKAMWCEECCKHIQGECPIHKTNQGPGLTYAVRSFPQEVQLCTSSIPGHKYGACAGKPIPCGTWIGPYEGKRAHSTKIPQNADGGYVWEIYVNGQFSHFIDGSDEGSSSWMRFIRCARNKHEQNMGAFQYGQNIYYRALRDIPVAEEILVWYDNTYTQFWGVPLALNSEIKVQEDPTKMTPTVAQHSELPGFRGAPQVSAQQSPSSRLQNVSPPQRSPTQQRATTPIPPQRSPTQQRAATAIPPQRSPTQPSVHATITVPPLYSQPTSHQLQRQPLQVPPQYQVPRPFHIRPPFQPPLPPPVSAPYPPSFQLPPFPIVQPRMPLVSSGKPISHVRPSHAPQPIFTPRGPQLSPSSQLHPNSPPGIQTAKPFSRPTAEQNERGPMNYAATSVTPSHYYKWSPTEIKENLPVSGHKDKTDMQIKSPVNSKPLKSCALQNRCPTSLINPAVASSDEEHDVSSTVDSNQDDCSWKCGQCGKTFGQRLILQMHVCSQSPERPFQCGHCSLSFTDSSELRDHVVTHTNDRPFKCGFCGRSFAGATTLNNHMRTHTGEKPFSCEKCGRNFAIATQLNRHIKVPGECGMRGKDAQMFNQRAVMTA